MRKLKEAIFFFSILIVAWFGCRFAIRQVGKALTFSHASPEKIFRGYVLDDYEYLFSDKGFDVNSIPIPAQVTTIQGLEIVIISSLNRKAYLRFRASEAFINEMIAKEHEYYNYTSIGCHSFFTSSQTVYLKDYPEEFDWWTPLEVETPICYRVNDTRFLLIDTNHNEVYYYRPFRVR